VRKKGVILMSKIKYNIIVDPKCFVVEFIVQKFEIFTSLVFFVTTNV